MTADRVSQSISMNLLWRPTSKALGRQKYNENTTASQCHNNHSAKRWVLSLVKKSVYVDEVRMCEGRRFQADGAATEKELFESWRLNRGTIKSPSDVDRSRVSEHGWQSSLKYVDADPWTTRYIIDWVRFNVPPNTLVILGTGFTGQMTQPTVSKHWRKIGPKD